MEVPGIASDLNKPFYQSQFHPTSTSLVLLPQGDSVPAGDDSPFADTVTLEQKTSSIGGTSGKVSLWMQWMLPKVTVKLFAPDAAAKLTGTWAFKRFNSSIFVSMHYTVMKAEKLQKAIFLTFQANSL